MSKLPQRVHVIGICGVATSALAIAFHKKGAIVTGSDKGFFPPVSTELEKQGISFYAGWHPEKMNEKGQPDLIIVGTASGTHNPETAYAAEHAIPMYSFAEAIGEFFARENSIVCCGTWGKTSSSALLSFILDQSGLDPTYMFGGISLSHESSARLSDSPWSVFEGDEYKSSPTDNTAKFFYYKATHLLLTAISWDHADLYPTENEYFEAFRKLIRTLSSHGFITACADHPGVNNILTTYGGKVIWYGKVGNEKAEYTYDSVTASANGLKLTLHKGSHSWEIVSPMLGVYQAENIAGCFALAHSLDISADKIIKAISQFQGLKRRLEKRLEGKVTVIDDIAHSPEKATSVLDTLRKIYGGKIITVFEPNIGGRRNESVHKYDNAFVDSDMVIIPRLTKLKVAEKTAEKATENNSDQPLEGNELVTAISKTHKDARYIDDDTKLVQFLADNTKEGDVIAFLGSHGFRGMIEESIAILEKK